MPNVHLGPHFEQFVQQQIDGGRFQNVSEVVRAGLRLLEDSEAVAAERRAAIRAELATRASDGAPRIPAEEVFASLRIHHEAATEADERGA
jgi:antitoxin ParD1/3/4